jgi:hypothetical protein
VIKRKKQSCKKKQQANGHQARDLQKSRHKRSSKIPGFMLKELGVRRKLSAKVVLTQSS